MKNGNLKGTAKLPMNNMIKRINDPSFIPENEKGKVMTLRVTCLDSDIDDVWAKNFATIPITLSEYKKHRKDMLVWLKARTDDLFNEVIRQLDEKAGV